MSIEIDPPEIEMNLAQHLFDLGFNRLSIGVQDIELKVQQAINRVQSTEFISDFIAHAKQVGFNSINIDLIYGLPHQTIETFTKTLEKARLLICIICMTFDAYMKQQRNHQRFSRVI